MDRELYGREAVFQDSGLAARLTGLAPEGFARTAYEHGDDPPVTVFTGGRGMGKTVLLKQLRNAYKGATPLALLDCAHIEPPADHGPGWNPLTGALAELAGQLAPRGFASATVKFPRLSLGLVAVASTSWSREDEERARHDLQRLGPVLASVDAAKGAGATWVTKVLSKLAANFAEATAPMAGLLAEATVETVLEEVFGRSQRRSESWYGNYRDAGGRGKIGLQYLANDFEQGGRRRQEAESFLVGALIEDLYRAYTGLLRAGARRGRPVLLLDNAHVPLGRRLIEPILRDRASGRRDRVVVFATSRVREHEGMRRATRLRLPETARLAPCPRGTDITSGILAVELTPLSPAHAQSAFDRHDPAGRTPADLARGVHRLAGGRPLGVTLLSRAAGEAPAELRSSLTPGALLDLTVELREDTPPVPVAPTLLEELLPGEPHSRLAVLAAAHDETSARLLAHTRLPGESPDGDMALEVRDRLRAEGWPTSPEHFVADPLLRALLLHRLRFEDGETYATWRAVHETLHQHYDQESGLPHRLHHELALGRTGQAVTHLRVTFPRPDVEGWLGRLRFIASAPYPRTRDRMGGGEQTGFIDRADSRDRSGSRDRTAPDPRRAVALGQLPPDRLPAGLDSEAAELHLRLRRLLHAVWLLTDPLALPDEEVTEKLAHELRQLSGRHLTGNRPLWDAATHWPTDIRAWRELSLPPSREDGV
ncbi:hypothetical protein GPZ77_15005 [Streptomyces sp. QHH-9511]|uniref:hypothetical protein n=1 Tax=Streptomyces sp. QHH-9511 TaxID=2684468 RepID=UPI0013195FD1|nr:hypothetical protein [Streptomyces sp. QHH-9511]QGZ49509.1 hypothetical protein GPZ77_15005 [Streptomyces sp. QHH-9511]